MKRTFPILPASRIFTSIFLALCVASSAFTPASSSPAAAAPNPAAHYLRSGPALADLDLGVYSGFTLGDIDRDGDADALAGDMTGRLVLYSNGGGPNVGSNFYHDLDSQLPDGLRPEQLDYSDSGLTYVHPELVDNDSDGDKDLFIAAVKREAGEDPILVIDYFVNDGYFHQQNAIASVTLIPEEACRLAYDEDYEGFATLPWYTDIITLATGDLNHDGIMDGIVGIIYDPPDSNFYQYQLRIYMGKNDNAGMAACPLLLNTYFDDPKVPQELRLPGGRAYPELHDIDADGDLDLFVGLDSGVVRYFENTGTPTAPSFTWRRGPDNPLNPPDTTDLDAEPDFGAYVVPEFGILDTDSRVDFAALSSDGQVFAMQYDVTLEEPHLVPWQTNADFLMPLDAGGRIVGVDQGAGVVTFADLDGDGDEDALTGHKDGRIRNYKNLLDETGQRRFVELTGENRWFSAEFGPNSFVTPLLANFDGQTFIDIDPNEADYDLVIAANVAECPENPASAPGMMSLVASAPYLPPSDLEQPAGFDRLGGTSGGNTWALCYYENMGSGYAPDFQLRSNETDPFRNITVTNTYLRPAVVAADNYETFPDLIIGTAEGSLLYLHNLGDEFAPLFEEFDPYDPSADVKLTDPSDIPILVPFGAPAFMDVDGDTSPDLVIGTADGALRYFHNEQEPDVQEPPTNYPIGPFVEVTSVENPFSFIDTDQYAAPAFTDLDDDYDLDLVIGSVLNTFHFYENVTPYLSDQLPAFVDYRFNPLATVEPPNYEGRYWRSVNFADVDGDGDQDALVGGQVASEQYGIAYYHNIGTPDSPVFREQPSSANPFYGIAPNTIINVTLADTHPSKPGLEAYIGGSVGGIGYLKAYEYNTTTGKYTEMNPQPFTRTLSTNYGVGPRATFIDLDEDGDLDCYVALGYSQASNYGILRLLNEPDESNEALFITPAASGYRDNFWDSSNPFYYLYYTINYFSNQHSMNTTMVDPYTWWVGNDAGQVHTLLMAFEDQVNGTVYIDRVTDRRDPFKKVSLPSPTLPTAVDTNNDGFIDAYVASTNGMIQYFNGSLTPPPSAGAVYLPLIAK